MPDKVRRVAVGRNPTVEGGSDMAGWLLAWSQNDAPPDSARWRQSVDFIDALSGVTQEQKFKHRLYLMVMNSVAPRAASVRWQRTNVSPVRGFHANLAAMSLQRLATRAGKPFGIQPFADLQVADPEAWVRGAWRKAVEDALFGPRFLARGLVDPDVVREIWNAHLDGADHSRHLSGLVAIELFAQLMVDGDTT